MWKAASGDALLRLWVSWVGTTKTHLLHVFAHGLIWPCRRTAAMQPTDVFYNTVVAPDLWHTTAASHDADGVLSGNAVCRAMDLVGGSSRACRMYV